MMRFGKISLAAIAAASLVSAPVMAEVAAPAKSVAVSKVQRVGKARSAENKIGKGSGVIVALLAAAAVVGGILIASGNNNDTPTSPG
jgi:hypothetical protein